MVGVTGTNGKTTTTYLLERVFEAAGITPGVIGTTGVRIAGTALPFDRTTPEAPDLQRLLAQMAEGGVRGVAMEVSSHGLDQHRVDGIRFGCALFTNLSQDHLDYHGDMEDVLRREGPPVHPRASRASASSTSTIPRDGGWPPPRRSPSRRSGSNRAPTWSRRTWRSRPTGSGSWSMASRCGRG